MYKIRSCTLSGLAFKIHTIVSIDRKVYLVTWVCGQVSVSEKTVYTNAYLVPEAVVVEKLWFKIIPSLPPTKQDCWLPRMAGTNEVGKICSVAIRKAWNPCLANSSRFPSPNEKYFSKTENVDYSYMKPPLRTMLWHCCALAKLQKLLSSCTSLITLIYR